MARGNLQRASSMKRPELPKSNSKRGLLQRTASLSRMPSKRNLGTAAAKQPGGNVHDCVAVIEKDVERLTRGADYLMGENNEENTRPVAILTRNEILLGDVLGEGSFAQVFEVAEISLDPETSVEMSDNQQEIREEIAGNTSRKSYALKHLSKRLLRKPKLFNSAAADAIVEGMYLAKLNHPNILKLRGVAKDGAGAFADGQYDSFFFLTDRLTDVLDSRIGKWRTQYGKVPPEKLLPRKVSYGLQITNALLYLHERRIIFRDLKPQNIGFKGEHTIQLFDFGLCRELPPEEDARGSDKVYMMSGAGTRRYMAVEIFIDRKYNLKADVYSMTMIFYEMLAQVKPFAKFTRDEHQEYVCEGGERPPMDKLHLTKSIESFLDKGWNQIVSVRYTMAEAREGLRDILKEMGEEKLEELEDLDDETERAGHDDEELSVHSSLDDESLDGGDGLATSGGSGASMMGSKSDMTMMTMTSNVSNASVAFGRTISHVRLWFQKGKTSDSDENADK
jgi:serine/threonine protein kinase